MNPRNLRVSEPLHSACWRCMPQRRCCRSKPCDLSTPTWQHFLVLHAPPNPKSQTDPKAEQHLKGITSQAWDADSASPRKFNIVLDSKLK